MDQNITRGKATVALSTAAYSGTLSVADTVYVDGGSYLIKPSSPSVDSPTLNLNSIGAKSLYKNGNVKVCTTDLKANVWYEVIFNSTLDGFVVKGLPQTITAEYDFATRTGAQGTYVLTSQLPVGTILKLEEGIVTFQTAPTSAGDALMSWGVENFTTSSIDSIRAVGTGPFVNGIERPFQVRSVPVGSLEITAGAGGTIDTVTVAGVNILRGTVAFNTSLTITAANVATNISTNPIGNIKAESIGAVIYLYVANTEKFVEAYSGSALLVAVSATATTMTVGNFNNLGTIGTSIGDLAENIRVTPVSGITFTIAGADLTAGRMRLRIPYDID